MRGEAAYADALAKVNALNTMFVSTFATHLFENRIDVFDSSSGPAKLFIGLLNHILQKPTPAGLGFDEIAISPNQDVDYIESTEFWSLQYVASTIIKSRPYQRQRDDLCKAAGIF